MYLSLTRVLIAPGYEFIVFHFKSTELFQVMDKYSMKHFFKVVSSLLIFLWGYKKRRDERFHRHTQTLEKKNRKWTENAMAKKGKDKERDNSTQNTTLKKTKASTTGTPPKTLVTQLEPVDLFM